MKGAKDDGLPVVVCMPLSIGLQFADNLVERCRFCHCEVQLRPHMPWPRHVACVDCFRERVDDTDTLAITSKSIQELHDYAEQLKRKH